MNIYERLKSEEEQKRREKELKKASLEKQLETWTKRQAELRKMGDNVIDKGFQRRQLAKCSDEIDRINAILSKI